MDQVRGLAISVEDGVPPQLREPYHRYTLVFREDRSLTVAAPIEAARASKRVLQYANELLKPRTSQRAAAAGGRPTAS
jgi:DNA helicase IV